MRHGAPSSRQRPTVTPDLYQQLQATLGPDYALERELGGGGMSRVFLAEEKRFGRRVVVKVLTPDLGVGLSAERFEREIRFAAQLQDPRIVPLLQAGHADELHYYTMPYIEGETLRDRLVRDPISVDEATGILLDVAMALEYAHTRKVVHRDIKPENILITGRTAVVTDFGIAKAITDATLPGPNTTLTKFGSIVGTPAYMAPEQAAGDMIDARADLYAWGMVAHEMLSGVHPFARHTTAHALLAAQISETPKSLAEGRRDLPSALVSIVDRSLSKDPALRPAAASEIVAALGAARALPTAPVTRKRVLIRVATVLAALALLAVAARAYLRYDRSRWVRDDAVKEAMQYVDSDRSLLALQTLQRAQSYAPGDTQIARVLAEQSRVVSVASSPSGATVSIQDYLAPESAPLSLGITPLKNIRIPKGLLRWHIDKPGVGTLDVAPSVSGSILFAVDSALAAPAGMVRVNASTWENDIAFIGWVGPYKLPTFFIDKFEVTNREYQQFVDKGGYTKQQYWKEPFTERGAIIPWDVAITRFRDRSGRAGPSTWEGGHYPDGKAEFPVSGVSWYEAAAFEEFSGKNLPVLVQWFEAAPPDLARYVVNMSNIGKVDVAPVGSFKGLGSYGTYDMAGNVREWTRSELDNDRHFILGGAANGQTYLYIHPEALSSFDRSPENGIRGVRNTVPLSPDVTKPVKQLTRNFAKIKPASDEVFRAYQLMFAYSRVPLNAKVDATVDETKDWKKEKISFDSPYNNERITAFLFLPKRVKPPFQTVIFFPSARVNFLRNSRTLGDTAFFDYVVQSGRAVMYPIYQETYERRVQKFAPGAAHDIQFFEQRYKDFARSIDYLQTRNDIDSKKLGYLGVSMGSAEGVIYTTLAQDRLKAVVLLDGGFFLDQPPPGADVVDYAPRLKTPTLMVNGRFDFTFPMNESQLPLYRMLGAPAADKNHIPLETPHDVLADRPSLVREVLAWYDKYLGRVQ